MCVLDSTGRFITYYLNGEPDGGGGTNSDTLTTGNDIIGAHWSGGVKSSYSFKGIIGEVMIFNKELTASEAYRIYNNELPTNALGDYCAQHYPNLLEKNIIKAVDESRYNQAILPEQSRTVNPDAKIITPGDL